MKQNGGLPCIIYDAKSMLRQPRKLVRGMWKDLLSSRELAWRLLVRDINAKYRQTALGFTWAFIPPLFAAIALTLANNADVISVKATNLPYPAYIVFSMALWQTFVAALNGPIQA
ncbi:MAG: ABC transporter permease, partial [Cyanobacteria bacterium J06642_12]